MDKIIEMFEADRQLLLLLFLFLVMLGVCLHLHGDLGPTPDAALQDFIRWAREATAGILGAILIKINVHPAKVEKPEPPKA